MSLNRLGRWHGGVELEQVVHRLPTVNRRLLLRYPFQRSTRQHERILELGHATWKGKFLIINSKIKLYNVRENGISFE